MTVSQVYVHVHVRAAYLLLYCDAMRCDAPVNHTRVRPSSVPPLSFRPSDLG